MFSVFLMFTIVLTKWLHDRQVSLDDTHRCSHDTGLLKHMTTPPGQHTVDSTHCNFRALKKRAEGLSCTGNTQICVTGKSSVCSYNCGNVLLYDKLKPLTLRLCCSQWLYQMPSVSEQKILLIVMILKLIYTFADVFHSNLNGLLTFSCGVKNVKHLLLLYLDFTPNGKPRVWLTCSSSFKRRSKYRTKPLRYSIT